MNWYTSKIKKLYVIGNGFDKHHGMDCGYDDFNRWLRTNRETVFDDLVKIYGDLNNDWWSKFEESLSNFDPDKFPHEVANSSTIGLLRKLEERYGEEGRSFIDNFDLDEDPDEYFRAGEVAHFVVSQLKNDLCIAFGDWVMDLKMPDESKKDQLLDNTALFFTFNYTRTLEDFYGIEEDNVIHLHGSIDDKEFVFGHNMTTEEIQERDLVEYGCYRDPNVDNGEWSVRMAMFDEIGEFRKPVEDIIQSYGAFFYSDSLRSVEELEVLGFSYSPIDIIYLERIIEGTDNDINVRLSWHVEEDKANAESFACKMGLTNYKLFEF